MLLVERALPARRRYLVRIAVLERLHGGGWSVPDRIADAAGYLVSQVRRALMWLHVHGLVQKREVRDERRRFLEWAA